jgi:hypothetical protein
MSTTEWGYLQSAPPAGVPSLLSRYVDLNYTHHICTQAFPDGETTSESIIAELDKLNSG